MRTNYGRYPRRFFHVGGDMVYRHAMTSLLRLTLQGIEHLQLDDNENGFKPELESTSVSRTNL